MCFVIHVLPHNSWSVSGSMGRILFSNVAGESCLSLFFRRLHTFAAGAVFNASFPIKRTIRALYFKKDLVQLEVLGVSHAGDQLLRLFAERIEFLSLVQILLFTSHGSGDSQNVGSVVLRFPCDWSLLSELLSEVFLELCNPRTSRFVRIDGRRMFSMLQIWREYDSR